MNTESLNAVDNSGNSHISNKDTTTSDTIEIPKIELPKGGGALKSIDEKFEVNASNGTAGFAIPLPISPGRNGFNPSLALRYNSGSGNSAFGLGWDIGQLSIQRKTDKKLPRYADGGDQEDTFMFTGAEDLVPFLQKDTISGDFVPKEEQTPDGYFIKRYRPRVEKGFARIEKIWHQQHGTYWKITTRNNTVTLFGRNPMARIADPDNPQRIFKWLAEFSYDDKGNWIQYHYKKDSNRNEDGSLHTDQTLPNEAYNKNRKSGLASYTNTYLKRITYGNKVAYYADPQTPYDPQDPAHTEYFFELVLDYGEHDLLTPTPTETQLWEYREDAFSSYRSGFEIRTSRICKRVLMFHHFKDEKQFVGTPEEEDFGINYLVRSLDFEYQPSSINNSGQAEVTYLKSITQNGYIRKPNGQYSKKSLPKIEYTYQNLSWNTDLQTIDKKNIANIPTGLSNNYQWADLYSEGISGILTEQEVGWFYNENLGNIHQNNAQKFADATLIAPKPSFSGLSEGNLRLQDLEANGKKQIVVHSHNVHGYFELSDTKDWEPFKSFVQQAHINLEDPNIRLIDLDGDGQPELVVTEENLFIWYPAKGKRGYLPPEFAHKTFDEEKGPAILFADQQQTIFLADMSGDGLTDIVRIRNKEICYWANKGYGKFSAKITMKNAPQFDLPDQFNPQYLHLADISGTGATDIVYIGKNTCDAFINLGGNAWSDSHTIDPFFPIDNHSKISVIDLLGTGTSCIVWSSELPAFSNAPMRYIDLMASKKPHILIGYKNNMGKETTLEYKSATYFYLKDKAEGNPWITKLPFPVQVVSKHTIEEKITDIKFTTEYQYHHGYYDHTEREFRGFGRVDTIDTEHYPEWYRNNITNALEKRETLYQKPILTKSWYHTGAYIDKEHIFSQFQEEYWYNIYNSSFPGTPISVAEPMLDDAVLADDVKTLSGRALREAFRACKGMTLRTEVFALDAPEYPTAAELQLQMKPYTVNTHNCYIQLLQPQEKNKNGVFLVTENETISISYERDESDPRISQTLHTKIDDLGNILESATIVYGRTNDKADQDFNHLTTTITDFSEDVPDGDISKIAQLQTAFAINTSAAKAEQLKNHIIFTQNTYTQYNDGITDHNDIDTPQVYRLRLPSEAKTYEITGIMPVATLFTIEELENVIPLSVEIEYHQLPTAGLQRRLTEHKKIRYLDDTFSPLNFGYFDTNGLTYESYQLAFTPGLVTDIYTKNGGAMLESEGNPVNNFIEGEGGYTNIDANLWIRSGISHYKENPVEAVSDVRARFFAPLFFEDPLGTVVSVIYDTETFTAGNRNNDGNYLFIKETLDMLQNKEQVAVYNYRSLSPMRMIDINANPSTVLVDELGIVKALIIEGNGTYTDETHTAVNIVESADSSTGLKEYTLPLDTNNTAALFAAADHQSTDTAQMMTAANTLLQQATTRFVYNMDNYSSTGQPNAMVSIIREEHFAQNNASTIQLGFEYSNGTGTVVMSKTQAEPGLALYMDNGLLQEKDTGNELRWIGNGRTVLNNKGKPVKQYEPYFSTNFLYENNAELVERGVSPIMYYDAAGRLIKTEFPDGTFSKVTFDSWKQYTYDQNDTVLESDWYTNRINNTIDAQLISEGKDPAKEKKAAQQTVQHADTPSMAYLDSLGRIILNIAHNGKDALNKDKLYTTFTTLDIKNNTLEIIDARGNSVSAYKYGISGTQLYQHNMDSGEHWTLYNCLGNLIYSWDSKDYVFSTTYDLLQRPVTLVAETSSGDTFMYEKMVYGETQAGAILHNLRGKIAQHYDASGRITNISFDYKGGLLQIQKQLAAAYQSDSIDWTEGSPTNQLEADSYTQITQYDALGRMKLLYNWHLDPQRVTVYDPVYNQRGTLAAKDHITDAQITPAGYLGGRKVTAISNIEYNEKGQRIRVQYANGTTTRYSYDNFTFRVIQMRTIRTSFDSTLPTTPSNLSDPNTFQNLYYTYDAVGNITTLEDDAYEPVFFNNQLVEPKNQYTYDAMYRIIQASGRENSNFNTAPTASQPQPITVSFPKTDQSLRNYTQIYSYDPVGNIIRMRHITNTTTERWTRNYAYATDSNRVLQTWIGNNVVSGVVYQYDTQGNILNYNNAPDAFLVNWDYRNQVHNLNLGGGGQAFYQYDTSKQRSRKRIEKPGGIVEERYYLGGMELYKRWEANVLVEEIETHHLYIDKQRVLLVENILQTNNNQGNTGIIDRYQYSNHLGSVGLELDGNGAIISYEEYHPFGTTAYQAVNATIQAVAKRYCYTGLERDAESGLSYHGARYYLPWLGRWLSSDPIGIKGGINVYAYSNNNPMLWVDKAGTQPTSGEDESPVQIQPIFTRTTSLGVSGTVQGHNLFSSDRSVSGRLALQAGVRTNFLLSVPSLELDTTGYAFGDATAAVDTELGRGALQLEGGFVLGDVSSGLNFSMTGQGTLLVPVPGRIPLSTEGATRTFSQAIPSAQGEVQATGSLAFSGIPVLGTLSLLNFSADATLDAGQVDAEVRGSTIGDGSFRLDASGSISDSGEFSLSSFSGSARLGIPGLRLRAEGSGTANDDGGVDIQASARLRLLGIPSISAQGSGQISPGGYNFSGAFSGYVPPLSYVFGRFSLDSDEGYDVGGHVFGLTYTPSIDIEDPSPLPSIPGITFPDPPEAPSGLTLGYSFTRYNNGAFTHFSLGAMAPGFNSLALGGYLQLPF